MRAAAATLAFSFVLVLGACKPPDSAAGTSDDPDKCESESDCHLGACGPCTSGTPITQAEVMKECVVNPCPSAQAACANHVCVVK